LPVVQGILAEVRRLVEADGWDAPFTVYGIRRPVPLGFSSSGETTVVVELERLGEGSHPFEDLPGLRLPEGFDAAILATEGWSYPSRLRAASPVELALEGAPSTLPDRVENRMFSYLGRAGDSATLILLYEDRAAVPEEVFAGDDTNPVGRVQDVFRCFVGLPVGVEEEVVHLLGRFWLGGLLAGVEHVPGLRVDDPLATAGDPLETFVAPVRAAVLDLVGLDDDVLETGLREEVLDAARREEALREFALEAISRLGWEDMRRAALAGAIDVGIPHDVVEWCDAGMFARLLLEGASPQRDLLDELLRRTPVLATGALEELERRGWLEPDLGAAPPARTSRPGRNASCPCGSGRKFKHCHGTLR